MEEVAIAGPPKIAVRATGFPTVEFQIDARVRPLLAVRDGAAVPLGYYAGETSCAVAKKSLADATVWFCGLPLRHPSLIRAMFRSAGVHIYDDNDGDVVYCGGGLLCVHSADGGRRTLALRGGKSLYVKLPPRSTTVYDETTGEPLLAE